LNAWLGGFENMLKRMSPGNFDWFLHAMLFYHTRNVISRQRERDDRDNNGDDEDFGGDGELD
jgi:hypothetical protein